MVRKSELLIPVVFLLVIVSGVLAASDVSADAYYVAGGLLTAKSEAFLTVLNPEDHSVNLSITAFFPKNDSFTFKENVRAHSSKKIIVRNYLPTDLKDPNFGLKIITDSPVFIEHSMYDSDYSCGFGDVAVDKPSFSWYFAEGFTSKDLNTWLFLTNPSEESVQAEVTLYYEGGQKKVFDVDLPSKRSRKVDMHDESLPDKKFGITVASSTPIVAETLNYEKEKSGCSGGFGSTSLSDKWYFAEGYISVSASEFLNIVNPSTRIAHVTLKILYDDGTSDVFLENVGVQSKRVIWLDNQVTKKDKWFSTVITSDEDIIAELTHYDEAYSAAHGGVGATSASDEIYFAEGYVSPDTRNYLAIFNPGEDTSIFNITFFYDDSTKKTVTGEAQAGRSSVNIDQETFTFRNFGFVISSDHPLIAQRVFFDKKRSGGYSSFGIPVDHEKVIIDEKQEDAPTSVPAEEGIALVKEESFDADRFGDSAGNNLASAVKSEYAVRGQKVVTWVFSYSSEADAAVGSGDILSGGLFDILERTPTKVAGRDAFYVVAEKSEGYALTAGSENIIVLANRGSADAALELAEEVIAERSDAGFSWKIVLATVILVLIIFFIIRRFVMKKRKSHKRKKAKDAVDEDDVNDDEFLADDAVEDAPKKAEKKTSKKGSKKEKPAEKKHEAKSEVKANHIAKKHVKIHEIEVEDDAEDEPEPKHAPKKHSHKKDLARVVEYDDMIKDTKDVPTYDDVFRHVNRNYDEIKPK